MWIHDFYSNTSWSLLAVTIDDLEEVFRYELCSYPVALFDTPVTLHQPQKATLADTLWTKLSSDAKSSPSGNVQYVLDVGALHRVPWPRQVIRHTKRCATFTASTCCRSMETKQQLCSMATTTSPSQRASMTHQRCSGVKGSATVSFSDGMN